jgi:myosin heavy subunit
MSTSSSSQRLKAIATVFIIALLGLNGYLMYSKINQDKLIKKQNAELIESEKLQTDLEKEYYQALSDLEELRGDNTEANSMIESLKEDLKGQKERISALVLTEKNYQKAREELGRLKASASRYLEEIKTLKQENEALSQTNLVLSEEKKILTTEITKERQVNDDLMTARATLTSEKEILEAEKMQLAEKVSIASVIKTSEIRVEPFKLKTSGKESIKKRAKAIDGLKICFSTLDNDVVSAGRESFFIRIINPLGETMAVESLGSGVMKLSDSGEDVRYSTIKLLDYENAPSNECVNWQPDIEFQSGNYTVELYNKGHLVGSSNFALK